MLPLQHTMTIIAPWKHCLTQNNYIWDQKCQGSTKIVTFSHRVCEMTNTNQDAFIQYRLKEAFLTRLHSEPNYEISTAYQSGVLITSSYHQDKKKKVFFTVTFPGTLQVCLSWCQVTKKLALLATRSQHCSSARFEYKQLQPSQRDENRKKCIVLEYQNFDIFHCLQRTNKHQCWPSGVPDYPFFWECLEFS